MSTKYFALLTNIGAAKLAKATALGMQVEITQMAVGDGNDTLPTPDPAQTALAREIRRAPLNVLTVDPLNTSQIIAEQVIPEDVGGWWIREIGLFDKDGDMVAIANCAETYKPQLQEGSGRVQIIRVILIVSSTQAVTLKIDPAVVLATRQYVDSEIIKVKGYVDDRLTEHAQSRNHPDATLTDKGFVQLSSATGSTDETKAATPKAVKAAMDNANKRQPGNENLTALSSLAGQPDKLPYFTNKGAMSLADFAAFMRTMLSKTDAASVLEYLGLKEGSALPVGVPVPWPSVTPPSGWFKCNGAAFDKASFPKLAVVYPSGFLPDLRGEFLRGWDDGRGVDSGRGLLSAQGDAIRNITGWVQGRNVGTSARLFNTNTTGAFRTDGEFGSYAAEARTPVGDSNDRLSDLYFDASRTVPTAVENRPRNVSFNYIVRAA
ncbi:phage tail protein [Salmonella enterica subsp. enterica serovar Thompson]|nr:phage tail protein [Salmonella enterica subsp. enterica serovar Thompson]